jgi:glutamine---fructose-6-phosphate transaminase (isomerizing)
MCGIFGHYAFNTQLSRRQILDLLLCGLHRLEYRGYDSSGMSIESVPLDEVNSDSGPQPIIIKSKGNIPALESLLAQEIQNKSVDASVLFNHHVGALLSHQLTPELH